MPPAPSRVQAPRARRWARLAAAGAWLSLTVNLAAWGLLYAGDGWGLATFLLFGPRWLLAVPPALLLLPARAAGRRPLVAAAVALFLALGPVMEFNLPWGRLAAAPTGGPRLRVLTCNMHYDRHVWDLEALVANERPDVVALQEWRESSGPTAPKWDGWHVHRLPGLFLASRYPIRRTDRLGENSTGEQGSAARYDLDAPGGPVALISLHLASPREELKGMVGVGRAGLNSLEANSGLRDRQSAYLAAQAAGAAGPVVLVGDFNTPPESVVFRRHWGDYRDAFGDAGWGWGYTFVNRWTRVRIDHILVGGGGRATACWVGPDVGSPHRPVLAEVAWPGRP